MIEGTIQEEVITVTNLYVPSIRTPQYIRQMLTITKGEINSNIIIVGDLRHLFCQWADHPGRKLTGNMGLKPH